MKIKHSGRLCLKPTKTWFDCMFPIFFAQQQQILMNTASTKSMFPQALPETIHMPKLQLEYLGKSISKEHVFHSQMASQGPVVDSVIGAWAYAHNSTNYNSLSFEYPQGVNMDRGAIISHSDGRMSACIADGVGGDGPLSTFVAHLVCQYIALELNKAPVHYFTEDQKTNLQIISNLLNNCVRAITNEFNHRRAPLKGSSTLAFATCTPLAEGLHKVQTAALGDSAIFHLSVTEREAKQLNAIHRNILPEGTSDISDCSGCIMANGSFYKLQNLEVASFILKEEDLLILATDGLLDNLPPKQIPEMISLIVCHPFFDRCVDELIPLKRGWNVGKLPTVPTVEQLKEFVLQNDPEGLDSRAKITTDLVTKRLTTYLQWLTMPVLRLIDRVKSGLQEGPIQFMPGMPKLDDSMIITIKPSHKI